MKRVLQALARRTGYEIRSLSGPHRVSSTSTALRWLAGQSLAVGSILDVGASDGRWSEEALRWFPEATCVLYEPNPVHLPGIGRFVARHPGRAIHRSEAVGARPGTATFDVSSDFGGSLIDPGTDREDGKSIDVPLVRLDDSVAWLRVQDPYLVKLDTHGFERGILEGATNVLESASVLIIEAYAHRITSEALLFWELCALLAERGFRPVDLVDVMHREYDGALWQMDLVFLRDSWPGFAYPRYR